MMPRKPFYLDTLYCCKCGKRYSRKDFNGDTRPMCPIHHIFLRSRPRSKKWKETLEEKQVLYRIRRVFELAEEFRSRLKHYE